MPPCLIPLLFPPWALPLLIILSPQASIASVPAVHPTKKEEQPIKSQCPYTLCEKEPLPS